ncbi:MAG: hypothetical protein WC955_07910 [Elusimicrobiota bacterium]
MKYIVAIAISILTLLVLFLTPIYCIEFEWSKETGFWENSSQHTNNSSSYSVERDSRIPEGWTGSIPITNPTKANCWGPNMLIDSSGTLHLVWSDKRSDIYRIYYKKSMDEGRTWTDDVVLSNTDGDAYWPKLGYDGNSILHLVFYEYDRIGEYADVYYKKSEDFGNNWSNEYKISASSEVSRLPDLVVLGSTVCIVREKQGDIYFQKSVNNGNTWLSLIRITTTTIRGEIPIIVSTSPTTLHVFYRERQVYTDSLFKTYYTRSDDGGTNWTHGQYILNSTSYTYPSCATMKGNTIFLLYLEESRIKNVGSDSFELNRELVFIKSINGGLNWGNAKYLSEKNSYGDFSSLLVDNYELHVVWGMARFYRKSIDDGETWSKTQRLSYDYGSNNDAVTSFKKSQDNKIYLIRSASNASWNNHNICLQIYDTLVRPIGKPSKPKYHHTYLDSTIREIGWFWDKGTIDESVYPITGYSNQVKEIQGNIIDPANFGETVLSCKNLNPNVTYCTRTRALMGNGYYTEWSDWSDDVVMEENTLANLVVYPNPFNPTKDKSITFDNLYTYEKVPLFIYTITGDRVWNGEKPYGINSDNILWDGKNINGNNVSSGIYLYKIYSYSNKRYKYGKIAVIK